MVSGDDGELIRSDYGRYLTSKISVDDRALNRTVLAELTRRLPDRPVQVLEVGAGLGTMVARLLDWQLIRAGDYTLVDVDAGLLAAARGWLQEWSAGRGIGCESLPDGIRLADLRVRLVQAELGDYLAGEGLGQPADLLIAHAFLDLVDLSTLLPVLLRQIGPGGTYWFTLNYDGETTFWPNHPHDDVVLGAYHRDMDDRFRYGLRAGESRTGRALFGHLAAAGAAPVAAGGSDWVVYAGPDGEYPDQEAEFLGFILDTIEPAVACRVDPDVLGEWMAARREQVDRGTLVYVAHQLDFAGPAPS